MDADTVFHQKHHKLPRKNELLFVTKFLIPDIAVVSRQALAIL